MKIILRLKVYSNAFVLPAMDVKKIVQALTSLSEIELDSETVSKIKVFSGTLQGVIDCAEKKLYKINPSVYASSHIPEVLVH